MSGLGGRKSDLIRFALSFSERFLKENVEMIFESADLNKNGNLEWCEFLEYARHATGFTKWFELFGKHFAISSKEQLKEESHTFSQFTSISLCSSC